MRIPNNRTSLLGCALLAAALVAGPAAAQDRPAESQPMQDRATDSQAMTMDDEVVTMHELTGTYTGVLVDPDVTFPRDMTHYFTVELDRLTPQAELEDMVRLLREEGQNALDHALWEKKVGTIQIDNSLGHPIAAAAHFDGSEDLGHLVLVIDRPIGFGEVFYSTRSVDYPFTILEIDLEESGPAGGEMLAAAQMRFTGDDLVIRNLAFQPIRLLQVEHEPFGERQAAN